MEGCVEPILTGAAAAAVSAGLTAALVGSVNGQAVLTCSDDGECDLKLEGLPVTSLGASCTIGECLAPTEAQFNGTAGAPHRAVIFC